MLTIVSRAIIIIIIIITTTVFISSATELSEWVSDGISELFV